MSAADTFGGIEHHPGDSPRMPHTEYLRQIGIVGTPVDDGPIDTRRIEHSSQVIGSCLDGDIREGQVAA